ncbi:Glucan endo-1,3-beta-glucosidase [Thalassocella blandensis]|nr:Glucan endo-1,3-beta-glucosidase [Thalassocella blandensis]
MIKKLQQLQFYFAPLALILFSVCSHAQIGQAFKGKGSRQPTVVSVPKMAVDPERWMISGYSHRPNKQLRNICIPGTHDSGTYGINGIDENISQTQEYTVGQQLALGYRYFDLRIKKQNGQFKIHHGPSISVNASDVFNDLSNFAKSHSSEVIFVHIQNVDSMSESEHFELRDNLVLPKLGDRMAPRNLGNGVTFKQLWDINKNVILIWGGGNFAQLSDNYWHQGGTMSSHWLNTGNEHDLYKGLRQKVQENRGGRFYVAQMILSPTTTQIIFPPYFGSIEDLTDDKVDHASLIYDLDMHAKRSGKRMNIAMVDFAGPRFQQYAFEACMDVNDIQPRYFSLRSKDNPDFCLDVSGGRTDNGTNVQVWSCNNLDPQKWYYEHSSGMLHSKLHPNKCLDNGGENWNNGKIVLWDCNSSIDNMRFDFYDDSLRVRQNIDIALDVSSPNRGSNVYQYQWHGRNNQRWEKEYESPYFALVNDASGMCLDVDNGNTQNGTNVRQWSCNGSNAQAWYYDEHHRFLRSATNPAKCLDNGGEPWNNGKIVLWNCNYAKDNMRFDFIDGVLHNAIDNNFVVDGYGQQRGDNVGQWEFTGGANQRWRKQ